MSRALHVLLPLALCAPLLAQKVDIKPKDSQEALRFTVSSQIQVAESRKMLVDGEEGGFGGRGGGRGGAGGPTETSLSQEIVFDQGPAGTSWRHYHKLAAVETRAGRDGEPRESAVEGALQGKKVYLRETDAGLDLAEGEAKDAAALPAALSRGVPGRVSLAGFLPSEPVEVGKEYEVGKGFLSALRGLVHPVTPDRSAASEGEGGRGQGRGRRGGGRGGIGGAPGSTVIQLIANGKLDSEATGKVLRVEDVDGAQVAVVALTAKLSGKGDAEALGLGPQAQGGRGGFGGGAGTNTIDASIRVEGTARVDVGSGRVTSVELQGELKIDRDTKRTMGREGEQREIQTLTETKGQFKLTAACETAK